MAKELQSKQDSCTILHTTHQDNAFLDEQYIITLRNLKDQDENYWRIYCEGLWGGRTQGIIYDNWSLIPEFPEGIPFIYGLDFGFNNPTALVKLAFHEKQFYVEELLYKTGLTNADLIEYLDALIHKRSTEIYCDSAEPQRIEEIHRKGYNAKPSNKSVKDGIDFCKRFNINIVDTSSNVIREIKVYKYKEDKNGKIIDDVPVKFKDHSMDAMRYGLFTHYKNRAKPNFRVFEI